MFTLPDSNDRKPLQERSRRTLGKILGAAEQLLEERLFEEVSIADVATTAGVSVGTIYTRFASKEALLPALFERHDAAVAGAMRPMLEELASSPGLRERVSCLVRFAVQYHLERRGLLRALTMFVRARPEVVDPAVLEARGSQYRAVAEAVAGGEVSVEAALFAMGVLNSVCREQVLFPDATPLPEHGADRVQFEERLINMIDRDLQGEISS